MKNSDNQTYKLKETIDGETKYYLPLETNLHWAQQLGYSQNDFVRVKVGTDMIRCIRIPATKEQYESYMRPILAEAQAKWRENKCTVRSEKTGKLIRCTMSCKNCPRKRTGSVLSLDEFVDENGYEYHDNTVDEESPVLAGLLFSGLMDRLHDEMPELATIFDNMFNGVTQRDIERGMGIPHSRMTDRVAHLRRLLQTYVSEEDIMG